jgi:hypothetical protein
MDGGADVVQAARQRQLLGAGAAAEDGCGLANEYGEARAREDDRGRQAIGSGADDDGVVRDGNLPGVRRWAWQPGSRIVPRSVRVSTVRHPAFLRPTGRGLTEVYLTQPLLQAEALSGGALTARGTVSLEALAIDRGELGAGAYGEGCVDARVGAGWHASRMGRYGVAARGSARAHH